MVQTALQTAAFLLIPSGLSGTQYASQAGVIMPAMHGLEGWRLRIHPACSHQMNK
jgi:hypothetical protein